MKQFLLDSLIEIGAIFITVILASIGIRMYAALFDETVPAWGALISALVLRLIWKSE